MDIGLSTASFYPDIPIEDTIELISGMGVGLTEIFLGTYSEYSQEFCQKLKENLDRYGVDVYSVHTLSTQFEPQLFARSYRQRKDSLSIWKEVLQGARLMGAKVYVFHGPPVRVNSKPELNFRQIAETIDEMADIAQALGIKLAWENVCWCWYSMPEFAEKLLEHVKTDNIYFTLDIKQAIKSGHSPGEYLRKMGNRVANVHVCDFDEKKNLYLPGMGRYNFKRLHNQLLQQDYSGPIMMEVYRENYGHYSEMQMAIEYLRDIFSSRSI